MYSAYQPTSTGSSVFAIIFYIVMAGLMLYSLIALYSLLRFGRSRILAITVSILYLIITAGLYAAAVTNLNAIK